MGLGPMCSPANLDACDEAKKKQINDFMALSDADMDKKISDGEANSKKVQTDFDEFVKGLQKQYEEANKKKEADIEALKAEGLGLLKAVKAHKKKANAEL